ncbi:MAG: peptide ABC transporter substrate-binding protein [Anaerolineae bacterium]|nr:peptide ABC transporter substrate-binding protein [Anaerolineae bacterium]MEB2366069.1 peptide ABC transporter substrate-binding protein [Chloroflexota bacterium]
MRTIRVVLLLALIAVLAVVPLKAQGKSATVSWLQEPDSLSPLYTSMTFGFYTYQLYLSPAWTFDKNLNASPVLVTEMPSSENGGISEDGKTFTLKLKEGLTWSDGDPLDSADFIFTIDMIMNDANAVNSRNPYDLLTSYSAPDATTVVLEFAEAYAPWQATLFTSVLPQHVLQPVFDAEGTLDNADFNRNPTVSSGPFVFDEWSVGSFMRFSANESFALGRPILDTIVVTFVPDDVTYVAGLVAGDADVGTFVAFSDVPVLKDAGLNVEILPSGYNEGWYLNVSAERGHPALQDVRVRQALAMGFDRFSFNEDLNYGATFVPSGFWENTPYDNPDIEPWPYDPEAAAALLDEAGWVDSNGDGTRDKDGVELVLRFITNTRGIRMDLQALAQQQLLQIGIGTELINYPSDVYFNDYAAGGPISTGQYDIAELSTNPAFPDPDSARWLCSEIPSDENPTGANDNYYCNEELDALFREQAATTDTAARVEMFHQIDQIMHDNVIWIGIWHDADVWIHNPRLLNAEINAAFPFWNAHNWDIAG